MAATTANMSALNQVILLKDFDPSKVQFEPATKNARNGKSVRITYGDTKQPLRIQLPELFIPFDMKQMPDDARPGEFTYSFETALQGFDEEGNKAKDLYDKMSQIDHLVLNTCVERSAEWLGETKNREVVEEFYRKLIRPHNPKFSPLLRIKAMRLNASGDMPKVFDKSNNNSLLDVSALTKGVRVKLIVTIPSVWLVNKNFGVSIKLFQACVTGKPSASISDYAFQDDDENALESLP